MPAPLLLTMASIEKRFPGVNALAGVDLELHAGEVLALLGENGAGKSTLMKTLGGILPPDSGLIRLNGANVKFSSPAEGLRAGVAIIHQELDLVPSLSAVANIFLGREASRVGWLNFSQERKEAGEILGRLGASFSPETTVADLSLGQRQLVSIAKALASKAHVLVMDEPTAALTSIEAERLFSFVRELASQGIGVIYITHRLGEVFTLADRIIVLRDGRNVGNFDPKSTTRAQLIHAMAGRSPDFEFPPRQPKIGDVRLDVRGLRSQDVHDVSFQARAGEIVGLAGLVGSGRTETLRLIFGADRRQAGEIRLDGETLQIRRPGDAVAAGIGLLPEDRKTQGLIVDQSGAFNVSLPSLHRLSSWWFVSRQAERDLFLTQTETLTVKLRSPDDPARSLSGGNQQKLVLAKWLARHCEVILFDEPTRGVDVAAKYEMHQLMNHLAAQGKTIVMASSELPEVLGMSDRVLVMRKGRIVAEYSDVHQAGQSLANEILDKALGANA